MLKRSKLSPSAENYLSVTTRTLILLTSLFFAACSDEVTLQPLSDHATILAFGDSLTYGTGTSKSHAYPAILQTKTNRTVINAGIPGEISANGLRRLPLLLQRYQPELLIICHGGNDILRKLDMEKAKQNIQQMIDIAKQNNTQVVLIAVPEFGLFLDPSPIYKQLADENKLSIDEDSLTNILRQNVLKSDHIHPNSMGYQLLAENIFNILLDSGAIQ